MTTYRQDPIGYIKQFMPETYKAIQAKAGEIGKPAYGLVRRALKGEANCFFAVEGGKMVGAPFVNLQNSDRLAKLIEQFGCKHLCLWAESPAAAPGGTDGTN